MQQIRAENAPPHRLTLSLTPSLSRPHAQCPPLSPLSHSLTVSLFLSFSLTLSLTLQLSSFVSGWYGSGPLVRQTRKIDAANRQQERETQKRRPNRQKRMGAATRNRPLRSDKKKKKRERQGRRKRERENKSREEHRPGPIRSPTAQKKGYSWLTNLNSVTGSLSRANTFKMAS